MKYQALSDFTFNFNLRRHDKAASDHAPPSGGDGRREARGGWLAAGGWRLVAFGVRWLWPRWGGATLKPTENCVQSAWSQRLKPTRDELLSNVAFKNTSRRYTPALDLALAMCLVALPLVGWHRLTLVVSRYESTWCQLMKVQYQQISTFAFNLFQLALLHLRQGLHSSTSPLNPSRFVTLTD
jgi:hypothetical protein